MTIERIGNRRKPKHRFVLFGELLCPDCASKLATTYLKPKPITMYYPGTEKVMAVRDFQQVIFKCRACEYEYDHFEEVPFQGRI